MTILISNFKSKHVNYIFLYKVKFSKRPIEANTIPKVKYKKGKQNV